MVTVLCVLCYSSHLVLTQDELILLRELSDRTGYARVKAKHSINCLMRITAKKKHPDTITFIFHEEDASTSTKYKFLIPNSKQFVDKIKPHLQPFAKSNSNDSKDS